MKNYLSLAALTAALLSANALGAGTLAGTTITNTASATYGDATGTAQPEVTSNTVTTTVQEVPSFTVLLNGQNSSGTPGGTTFTPAGTISARPGDVVSFRYSLTNTGNVADTYALSPQTVFGTTTPTNVAYYPASADTNSDGVLTSAERAASTPITSLPSVPADDPNTTGNDGSVVYFFATYNVPATATDGQTLGTNPIVSGAKATTADNDNYNQTTVSRSDSGLIGPRDDSNADGTVDNTTNTVAPYQSPEGRTITYSGDAQSASLPYTNAPQTITFTQTVKNTGNRDDVFDITLPTPAQLDAAGFPTGTTVELVGLSDTDGDGILDTGTLAPNGLAAFKSFQVRVTVPAGAMPDAPTTIPSVIVTARSSNDTNFVNTTTDNVLLSGVQFGESTAQPGTSPNPITQLVGAPGSTVSYPLDVYNAGNTNDSFTLSGSVVVPLTGGGSQTVPLQYYVDTNGNGVLDPAEQTAGPVTTTGTLAPGVETKLIATIAIPAGAASTPNTTLAITNTVTSATTGAVASDNNDTLRVSSTGFLQIKKFVDNCGKTNVCPAAPLFTGTAVNNAGAPQDVLRYTVIAKNNTNNVITFLYLKDILPENTSFVSVSGVYSGTGTIYYRVNGGAWGTTAPTTLTTGQSVEVAVDTDGNGVINASDTIAVGGELKMDFRVKIN
ncbi:hypothetical protein [Deinococcus hohokamensis]|uniref:DUF11 domain-containing protein n=1 Tax=Deinococcus hohokamensis TaxID=309883 RepID=A0ABV9I584_9DEIO